jgi:hypothetical protein
LRSVIKMPKDLAAILFPKRSGLIKLDKPQVVIVNSPYDEQDSAVRFKSAKVVVDHCGYGVINKNSMNFLAHSIDLKPWTNKGKRSGLTLWLEAHALPGYLFGNLAQEQDELFHLHKFIEFIKNLETAANAPVEQIVLSCCYSAAEYYDPERRVGFCSSARLLSLFLPNVSVVGFIGRNTSAKVTQVYTRDSSGKYFEQILDLVAGGVLIRNGIVIESGKAALYGAIDAIPRFIQRHCYFSTHSNYFLHSQIVLKPELLRTIAFSSAVLVALENYESTSKSMASGFFKDIGSFHHALVPNVRIDVQGEMATESQENEEESRNEEKQCTTRSKKTPIDKSIIAPSSSAAINLIDEDDDEVEVEVEVKLNL